MTILDRYHDAAVVKILANEWIDYLEMAKVDGAWKIINVLWALKPKPGEAAPFMKRSWFALVAACFLFLAWSVNMISAKAGSRIVPRCASN